VLVIEALLVVLFADLRSCEVQIAGLACLQILQAPVWRYGEDAVLQLELAADCGGWSLSGDTPIAVC
jgi:hypothetical protein